jgi:hypothetical protein
VAGDTVVVSGAVEPEYNVVATVNPAPGADSFTYPISGTPSTPATGTINAAKPGAYNFANVRGLVSGCEVITSNQLHWGFDIQVAGQGPTVAQADDGIPVVFDNCDVGGNASSVPYSLNVASSGPNVPPVNLPLGTIRKGSVIGGLFKGGCNLRSVTTNVSDVPIPIANMGKKYRITGILFKNASATAAAGITAVIRSGPNASGDVLVAAVGVTTLVDSTIIEPQTMGALATTKVRTETEIYMRMTTPLPTSVTCDIVVLGELFE